MGYLIDPLSALLFVLTGTLLGVLLDFFLGYEVELVVFVGLRYLESGV